MDVVEGRPSGTGRPSLPTAGDDEGAPSPFAGWLARGLAGGDRTGGASLADRIERGVEQQVAGRIRALDPAAGARRREDAATERRDADAEARGADASEGATERRVSSAAERDEPRRTEREERDGTVSPRVDEAGTQATRATPRELDGHERTLTLTDAADAEGAADGATSDGGALNSGGGTAGTTAGTSAAGAATSQGAAATNAATVVGAAGAAAAQAAGATPGATQGTPTALPVGQAAAQRAREAAAAAKPEATPAGPSPEDLELAETVMRQLRARLSLSNREAVIELRPSELGRIDVRLRFEDGVLSATIRAERPETLAVLEAHAPELRAWLAQDGAEVREIDLGLAEAGVSFERPAEQRRGSRDREPSDEPSRAVRALGGTRIGPDAANAARPTRTTDGVLDIVA